MLHVLTLCWAVYATPESTMPLWTTCTSYARPRAYDVTSCPGEVTTNARGDRAVCEVALEDNR